MDATWLKIARRHNRSGVRSWSVPGFDNAVRLVPGRRSSFGVATIHWPCRDAQGHPQIRGVRLDWHRSTAKAEIRKLIEAAPCSSA